MKAKNLYRKLHKWIGLLVAVPLIIILITGILLLLKKDFDWIQPPSQKGSSYALELSFDDILRYVRTVPKANIKTWQDINRLDVRPKKGIVKVRGNNDWEVQLDVKTGKVLQVMQRRSDFIESLHDGSFFHKHAKLWVFLPVAVLLVLLWLTGLFLFGFKSVRRKVSS